MFKVGRVCMKIAGRDAGKVCIVIAELDDKTVLIDGQTRRRKCNINHIEVMDKTLDISENADNKEVVEALASIGIVCKEKSDSKKSEEKSAKPKKQKIKKSIGSVKEKTAKEAKKSKPVEKKEKPAKKSKKAE